MLLIESELVTALEVKIEAEMESEPESELDPEPIADWATTATTTNVYRQAGIAHRGGEGKQTLAGICLFMHATCNCNFQCAPVNTERCKMHLPPLRQGGKGLEY